MSEQSQPLENASPDFMFRARGKDINRIEAFSDAVFAFSLTLLAISSAVPNDFKLFQASLNNFLPFALCFVLFITIWLQHYIFFRRYGLSDLTTIALNSALLLLVLFFVYPLKFLFTFSNSRLTFDNYRVLFMLYGFGFAAIYGIFALLYANAYRLRRTLELNRVEEFDTLSSIGRDVAVAAVGLGSVLLAQFQQTITFAGYFYFAILFVQWGYGSLGGRRRRALVAAERKRLASQGQSV